MIALTNSDKYLMKIAGFVLISATCVVSGFGQKPVPVLDRDEVVKISTTLIQVDVTITDTKGKPITDLSAPRRSRYTRTAKNSRSLTLPTSQAILLAQKRPSRRTKTPFPYRKR
jgi:hypothetical protein